MKSTCTKQHPEALHVFARVMEGACKYYGASVREAVGRSPNVQGKMARNAAVYALHRIGYTQAQIAGMMDRTTGAISASINRGIGYIGNDRMFAEIVTALMSRELTIKEQKAKEKQ